MIPAAYNLTLYQGDEFSMTLRMRLADSSPEVLTGKVVTGQIRGLATDAAPMVTFTCTVSNQATNPGELVVFLPVTESVKLVAGKAVYDVQTANVDGTGVATRIAGKVTISAQVTR